MPTTAFDTFFACTILVAAALIATAFFTSNMQIRINNTHDINKNSYLNSIADHIITSPGTPSTWGTSSLAPEDFGLAQAQSAVPYELDPDKVSRLNSQNNASLTYTQIAKAAKLDMAFGISVSQLMTISIEQTENHTAGSNISFTFAVSTAANSKPTGATLHAYIVANNYFTDATESTPNGEGDLTVQIPSADTGNALLVVFARATFDERITSYAIYNFANSAQQSTPTNNVASLSAIDYNLTVTPNLPDVTVQKGYLVSYSYQSNLTAPESSPCPFPKAIDKSPFIIIVCGQNGTEYFQEWTAYPQVPLTAGSSFGGSEKTIFSYIVTIKDSLYRLDLSFGGLPG